MLFEIYKIIFII